MDTYIFNYGIPFVKKTEKILWKRIVRKQIPHVHGQNRVHTLSVLSTNEPWSGTPVTCHCGTPHLCPLCGVRQRAPLCGVRCGGLNKQPVVCQMDGHFGDIAATKMAPSDRQVHSACRNRRSEVNLMQRAWIVCHWNEYVVILTKFSSLAVLEVVIMTTANAASDENVHQNEVISVSVAHKRIISFISCIYLSLLPVGVHHLEFSIFACYNKNSNSKVSGQTSFRHCFRLILLSNYRHCCTTQSKFLVSVWSKV